MDVVRQPWVKTVCETGFNAGHSAMLWLNSNPDVRLFSFDLGSYPYSLPAAGFMQKEFPERFTFVQGDSSLTLPAFRIANPHVTCDVSVVDGGHTQPYVSYDILNFWHMTPGPQNIVIMDDTPCGAFWCTGPRAAWAGMVNAGALKQNISVSLDPFRGYSTGSFVMKPGTADLASVPVPWSQPTVLAEGIVGSLAAEQSLSAGASSPNMSGSLPRAQQPSSFFAAPRGSSCAVGAATSAE